jgi:hypothetical protein
MKKSKALFPITGFSSEYSTLSHKFCRPQRQVNMFHFVGIIQIFLNYKLQATNYKQITNHKLQITNRAVSFGQVLNACGEELKNGDFYLARQGCL